MTISSMTYDDFILHQNVSRETFLRLERYVKILMEWQHAINLVARDSLDQVWMRHILDSAQIFNLIEHKEKHITDIGSGAGFPGMVLAMMGCSNVHLVESDQRKCEFLRFVSRETKTDVTIHTSRIESLSDYKTDIITARALADLSQLFTLSKNIMETNVTFLFLKGENCDYEVEQAKKDWDFDFHFTPSITSQRGRVLRISHLRERGTL